MPLFPVHKRQKWEVEKFKIILGYEVRWRST